MFIYKMRDVFLQLVVAVSTTLIFSTGCVSPEDPLLQQNDPDLSEVTSEVETALYAFHAADTSMNAQGVIDLLWPEYTMLGDGKRLGYGDVVAGSHEFMSGLDLFHTEWTDIEITPLGPNTALTSFQFRDSIITKTGDLIQTKGPTSFVWQQRDGEWRVLFADADHYPIED